MDDGEVEVAVAFHSDRGHVRKLAHSVAEGAGAVAGARSGLWDLADGTGDLWPALDRADAIVFGAPTYMGGPSAVFKHFAEATLPIWVGQGWRHKVAAGFTHSQAMSGDKLNTLQYFSLLAAQHGMVWVNLDLLPGWCVEGASIDDPNRLGAWLGVMSQSNGDGPLDTNPCRSDLATAEHLGRRVAAVTAALAAGRRAIDRRDAEDGEADVPVARRLYAALASRDRSALLALLHPEFEGEVTAGMPRGYGGAYRGPDAMLDVWARVHRDVEVVPEPDRYLVATTGEVVVIGRYVGRGRHTGRSFQAAFAHVFDVRDGRIVGLRQITDSHRWAMALAPDEHGETLGSER